MIFGTSSWRDSRAFSLPVLFSLGLHLDQSPYQSLLWFPYFSVWYLWYCAIN
jgi:hypothetical protein